MLAPIVYVIEILEMFLTNSEVPAVIMRHMHELLSFIREFMKL
jgi:hypothetical protein